jgi:hypothetical protein
VVQVAAALLCGCAHSKASTPEESGWLSEPLKQSRDVDDTTRFLAGLPGKDGSPYAALEANPAWKKHQETLDQAWRLAKLQTLEPLREFQSTELAGDLPAEVVPNAVFYPFGGPDSVTVTTLFPKAPAYVLVGMEPPGTVPDFDTVDKKPDLAAYLSGLRVTTASILGKSFFVTREMDRQLRGQVTDGVLLPLLHLLVRTDHTILAYRYIRIDEQGQVKERPAVYVTQEMHPNKGVEIEFRTDSDGSVHRLIYLSVNLINNRLKSNPGFQIYVKRLQGGASMLKATSYMPHHPEFSEIRDLIMRTSGAVLQDDSGLPYRYYKDWDVQLYGAYEKPYGSFGWLEQKDLREAFKAPEVKPLNAPLGYGYRKIPANLLLARKR